MATLPNPQQARRALARLHAAGIPRGAISLLMSEPDRAPDVGLIGPHPRFAWVRGHRLPEGVALGTALGGLLGAMVGAALGFGGLLSAGVHGLGWLPGSIPSMGTEGLVVTFAGAGFGGGLGSIVGAVVGLQARVFRPKLWADRRQRAVNTAMIAVWVDDVTRAQRVTQILRVA